MEVNFVIKVSGVEIANDNGGWGSTDARVGELLAFNSCDHEELPRVGDEITAEHWTANDGIYGYVEAFVTGIIVYSEPAS